MAHLPLDLMSAALSFQHLAQVPSFNLKSLLMSTWGSLWLGHKLLPPKFLPLVDLHQRYKGLSSF